MAAALGRKLLTPLLGRPSDQVLSAQDVALVREAEELMPEGPLACHLATGDGRPLGRAWEEVTRAAGPGCEQSSSSFGALSAQVGKAGPVVRRVAEAIMQELHRYFDQHPPGRAPTARSVVGGHLLKWAEGLCTHEPSFEDVRWWCEYLRRIEDERLFTRSNWARASDFEEALSHSRLMLLDLRSQLESTGVASELQSLREALEALHASGRAAADRLLELLYVALRPQPATERSSFHEIERRAMDGLACDPDEAAEDRLCYQILQLERARLTDCLATMLLGEGGKSSGSAKRARRSASSAGDDEEDSEDEEDEDEKDRDEDDEDDEEDSEEEEEEDTCVVPWTEASAPSPEVQAAMSTFDCARAALENGEGPPATRIPPKLVRAMGPRPVASFWELHGLYCLLVALLQRLELSLQAVTEYAHFVCFLPVYRATVIDMETLLPEIWRRTCAETGTLSKAYEMLPRKAAPPSRGAVLEKCRCLDQQISHCGIQSMGALVALRACTPQSTLSDFDGWQRDDKRWRQVARLQVAAQALLPARELVALNIPELAAHLRLGGLVPGQLRILDRASGAASERSRLPRRDDLLEEPASPSLSEIIHSSLGVVVDEDTRLHTLGCNIGVLGSRLAHAAQHSKSAQQVVAKLEGLIAEQCAKVPEGLPEAALNNIAGQVSKLVVSFLGPIPTRPVNLCDGDWVMVQSEPASPNRATRARASPPSAPP